MSTDEIVIRVDNVSKDFLLPHEKTSSVKGAFTNLAKIKGRRGKETQHALNDISFEIKKGEFFGIVGRNGSGKSTLLKILAGIYQPTSGKVYTRGKLVPFIELGVGFNPELTGRENVYLNGALLGFSHKEIEGMYDDIVAFAELERFMDQKLKNYSSGMQVRLAFSMATRSEADILLIDEVLAVGDADFQRKCFDYFKKLKKEKKTVVFVSHDMDAVREYCDKAVLIEKSKIVDEGNPDKIASKYTRLFIDKKKSSSNVSDTRWGTGSIQYSRIECEVKNEVITIETLANANTDIESPNFGFLIRDASGQSLLGTNTQLKNRRIEKIKNGQQIKIKWEVPNIFQDGEYSVEPAAAASNGEIFDWWEDASKFRIFKEERTPYLVNPDVNVKIEMNK